jgi:hypothetical protein
MSLHTRLLSVALQLFRYDAMVNGLSRQDMARELRNLRMESREFARDELIRHFCR